jgi:type II secretory pathway pseudopilin PulG
MSPALLAILAAIVGALLSGIFAFALRIREERVLQRAAEQLVREELKQAARMLKATLETKE